MGGVVLNVIDETTWNKLLQASWSLDPTALEIADAMLTNLTPWTKTKIEMAPAKLEKTAPSQAIIIRWPDETDFTG